MSLCVICNIVSDASIFFFVSCAGLSIHSWLVAGVVWLRAVVANASGRSADSGGLHFGRLSHEKGPCCACVCVWVERVVCFRVSGSLMRGRRAQQSTLVSPELLLMSQITQQRTLSITVQEYTVAWGNVGKLPLLLYGLHEPYIARVSLGAACFVRVDA